MDLNYYEEHIIGNVSCFSDLCTFNYIDIIGIQLLLSCGLYPDLRCKTVNVFCVTKYACCSRKIQYNKLVSMKLTLKISNLNQSIL